MPPDRLTWRKVPSGQFQKIKARAPVQLTSLWSRMIGFWPAFFQILGLSLALQVAVFAMPFQMQLVVDEAIFRDDRDLLAHVATRPWRGSVW